MMKYERKNLNIVIRGLHNRETEVEALWVVAPSSLMVRNQCFECRATSIFRVELRGQGVLSTALLPTQRGWFPPTKLHGATTEKIKTSI